MRSLRDIIEELIGSVDELMDDFKGKADEWIRLSDIQDACEELKAQIEEYEFSHKSNKDFP